MDGNCVRCGGLIAEPYKPYAYAGKFCHCASPTPREQQHRQSLAETLRKLDQSAPAQPCGCIGPQNGQPLCPCAMRGVIVKNGRYVRPEQDLGPAREVTL